MKSTILHVSDLHRDPNDPITNGVLFDSLCRDRDRYTRNDPAIPPPNLIIVSGDLVRGVSFDTENHEDELNRQYDEAHSFLVMLANEFVGGDKDRVVIIPGNHDVSFPIVHSSLKKLELEEHKNASNAYWYGKPKMDLRWWWKELAFFQIVNKELYARRLEAFASFYKRFYNDQRSYSLNPAEQCDLFDYPDLNLTVGAFSSCWNNDPIHKVGMIHPDTISAVNSRLRDDRFAARLRLAVWHHDTHGEPSRNDFLDPGTIQVLIDSGFCLGFHGHQHKAQYVSEQFQFGRKAGMTVFSAGSLCSGPRDLPSGHSRSYNLIEINTETGEGRLHVRGMSNSDFNNPVWTVLTLPGSQEPHVDFQVLVPLSVSSQARQAALLSEADKLMSQGRIDESLQLLRPLLSRDEAAHALYTDALFEREDWWSLRDHLNEPKTSKEAIYLLEALIELRDRTGIERALALHIVRDTNDRSIIEAREKAKRA